MAPPEPALLCFPGWVCHSANTPVVPSLCSHSSFSFSGSPLERRGLVRTPFPLCWLHQLLLSPTAEVSCCGASSQPHGNPTPLCCPAGLPSTASPLHPLGFHCSLQAPIPFPLNLRGAPQGGSDAHSSQHCPGLPLHPLKCCTHCWTPQSVPSLPHALSPVLLFLIRDYPENGLFPAERY